jgi:ABC-type molybdate transport system substrate-binding protein
MFDQTVDLVGNPYHSDLNLYLNGNQFMVMPDLLAAFHAAYPYHARVYYETLPPGLLADQIESAGEIRVGTLALTVPADVYTGGRGEMERLKHYLVDPRPYAQNRLALLVAKHNPLQISGFHDLVRPFVKIAMPNPLTEGIARLAQEAVRRALGEDAVKCVFTDKVRDGTTQLTTVHHRETLAWLEEGRVDVGVVWQTEAEHALRQNQAVDIIDLSEWRDNPIGQYWAAGVKDAPHPQARDEFLAFLNSEAANQVYASYGFDPVDPLTASYAGF